MRTEKPALYASVMAKDWTFSGKRDCPDCDPTKGKPKEAPMNQSIRQDGKPICARCGGSRIEERVFTKEELRTMV